jgi:hypothetical protein
VHIMYPTLYAAKFGRLGVAADTEHLEEGEGGRAQYCC